MREEFWRYFMTGDASGIPWVKVNTTTTDELRPFLFESMLKNNQRIFGSPRWNTKGAHSLASQACSGILCGSQWPSDRCIFLVLTSYSSLGNDDRPMMLGYDGNFLRPTLAAIIKPWANILYEQFNIPYDWTYNLLSKITMIYDCFPIYGWSTWGFWLSKRIRKVAETCTATIQADVWWRLGETSQCNSIHCYWCNCVSMSAYTIIWDRPFSS